MRVKKISLTLFFIVLALSTTLVSLNLPLSANAQNNELYQSGDNDEAGQNIGPRQASDHDNRITSRDSSILSGYNLLCQNQDDPILNGFCDHVNRNDPKASAQNQYLDNLDKSCIETESKGSNPDVNNIIKSCFSDRITPSLPNLGTNELKVGVTVFSDIAQTFQVIVKDLATLQSDSFRVTNDAPTVKTFEIPIGHPYSVEVGFNPTVTSIEWHFGISNCLPILGFTCLGIMTTSPQLVFVNISAP